MAYFERTHCDICEKISKDNGLRGVGRIWITRRSLSRKKGKNLDNTS